MVEPTVPCCKQAQVSSIQLDSQKQNTVKMFSVGKATRLLWPRMETLWLLLLLLGCKPENDHPPAGLPMYDTERPETPSGSRIHNYSPESAMPKNGVLNQEDFIVHLFQWQSKQGS